MTVRQAMTQAGQRLKLPGHDKSLHWLMAHVLSCDMAGLVARYAQELTPAQQERFGGSVNGLANGEPLQYLLGQWVFFGREFLCDARALIPRPETELLVAAVLAAQGDAPARVIDMGCGGGCIGITLKLERPLWQVDMLDISPEALALSRENAQSLCACVQLLRGDMRKGLAEKYDIIVSNPPYIAPDEWVVMDESVRRYEPELALYAPPDGMAFYHALANRAREGLRPGGLLAVECGFAQAARVAGLFAGMGAVNIINDDAGIARVVTLRANGGAQ